MKSLATTPTPNKTSCLSGCITELEMLIARAESIEEMARNHADFFDGHEPEIKEAPAGPRVVPNGQLGFLQDSLHRLNLLFNGITYHHERTSRALNG